MVAANRNDLARKLKDEQYRCGAGAPYRIEQMKLQAQEVRRLDYGQADNVGRGHTSMVAAPPYCTQSLPGHAAWG
jgi:hypothetical protein